MKRSLLSLGLLLSTFPLWAAIPTLDSTNTWPGKQVFSNPANVFAGNGTALTGVIGTPSTNISDSGYVTTVRNLVVGTNLTGSGSGLTNVNGILALNLANLGAKGDGTTDDTAAWQAAFNIAQTNGPPAIYIPPGTNLITSGVSNSYSLGAANFTNGSIAIYGVRGKSWVKRHPSVGGHLLYFGSLGSTAYPGSILIDGVSFDDTGNSTTNIPHPLSAIEFDNCTNGTLRNCDVVGCGYGALIVEGQTTHPRVSVENCYFSACSSGSQYTGSGIYTDGGYVNVRDCTFSGFGCTNTANQSIYANGYTDKVLVDGCTFTNCSMGVDARGSDNEIHGCTFIPGPNGSDGTSSSACVKVGNTVTPYVGRAIITDNTMISTGLTYTIQICAYANRVRIAGNHITSGNWGPPIQIRDGAMNVDVINNWVYSPSGEGRPVSIGTATNVNMALNTYSNFAYMVEVPNGTTPTNVYIFGDTIWGDNPGFENFHNSARAVPGELASVTALAVNINGVTSFYQSTAPNANFTSVIVTNTLTVGGASYLGGNLTATGGVAVANTLYSTNFNVVVASSPTANPTFRIQDSACGYWSLAETTVANGEGFYMSFTPPGGGVTVLFQIGTNGACYANGYGFTNIPPGGIRTNGATPNYVLGWAGGNNTVGWLAQSGGVQTNLALVVGGGGVTATPVTNSGVTTFTLGGATAEAQKITNSPSALASGMGSGGNSSLFWNGLGGWTAPAGGSGFPLSANADVGGYGLYDLTFLGMSGLITNTATGTNRLAGAAQLDSLVVTNANKTNFFGGVVEAAGFQGPAGAAGVFALWNAANVVNILATASNGVFYASNAILAGITVTNGMTNTTLTSATFTGTDANGEMIAHTLSSSDIAGALPGAILTNGVATATTFSNNVTVDSAHQFIGGFVMPTNGPSSLTLSASTAYAINLTANIVLANFAGVPNNQLWGIYLLCTNSSPSTTYTVTFPGGSSPNASLGYASPPVYYVTNSHWAVFQVHGWGTLITNISWEPH